MEVRRRGDEPRSGLTVAGPMVFLLVIWLGCYFTWRIVHGDRAEQGVVTEVIYPDDRVGRLAYDLFMPLRRLDRRCLGVESRMASDRQVTER